MLSPDAITLKYPITYRGPIGTFFLLNAKLQNISSGQCRESLDHYWRNSKAPYLGFYADHVNASAFEAFWQMIETKVGIPADRRSTVHLLRAPEVHAPDVVSEVPNAFIVYLSPFWTRNRTTNGFATLFMRLGAIYYQGNLTKAIRTYALARHAEHAIRRFLAGYTQPTYHSVRNGGIVYFLGGRTKAKIEEMLVAPEQA